MQIIRHDAENIKRVVKAYTDFLGKTYGPAGQTILIKKGSKVEAVDDGKLVAQDYELEDEFDNAIISYIREASEKTDIRVGDGSTTAAIIVEAIIEEVFTDNPLLAKNPHTEVVKLHKAVEEAVKQIKGKPIKDKKELYEVAYNSFNNEEVAHLIADTLFTLGQYGALTSGDSATSKTEVELVLGMELEKGYVSPYLVNEEDQDGKRVSLKDPVIFLVNKKLESHNELVSIIKKLISEEKKKEFVIVAEGFSDDVINSVLVNKNVFHLINPLLVENPAYGDKKLEFLKDLAAVTGASIIDSKGPLTFETLELKHLGSAESVVAKKDTTLFTKGAGKKSVVEQRSKEIKAELDKATSEYEKAALSKRLSMLQGGIAIIKVGANTDKERQTKRRKVEDAINATKAAYLYGVVEGAGKTFEKIETSSEVLNRALKAPRKQLIENGEEFLDDKVLDPAGVLIAALESAVSIASGLLKIAGISAEKREEKK